MRLFIDDSKLKHMLTTEIDSKLIPVVTELNKIKEKVLRLESVIKEDKWR